MSHTAQVLCSDTAEGIWRQDAVVKTKEGSQVPAQRPAARTLLRQDGRGLSCKPEAMIQAERVVLQGTEIFAETMTQGFKCFFWTVLIPVGFANTRNQSWVDVIRLIGIVRKGAYPETLVCMQPSQGEANEDRSYSTQGSTPGS